MSWLDAIAKVTAEVITAPITLPIKVADAANDAMVKPWRASERGLHRTRVKRHGRTEELGEIGIQFGSLDALNGLIDRLRGTAR